MKIEKDFEELLELFNKNEVRYCIVGSYALAFHAKPRYTKDIDILVEPDIENAKKIIKSLNDFGFQSLNLTEKDFSKEGKIIQLCYEPVRIDLLTSIPGCSFNEIWENKVKELYGDQQAFFIGLKELIITKKASNRKQDIADLEILQSVKKRVKR